jgi:hypothetical protein
MLYTTNEEKSDDTKNSFYEELGHVFNHFPCSESVSKYVKKYTDMVFSSKKALNKWGIKQGLHVL